MPLIHSFPFTAFETETGRTFRPLLHGRLRGPSGMVNVAMLLDSGADCSLIGFATARSLGLEMSRPRGGRGASGQFPGRATPKTRQGPQGGGRVAPQRGAGGCPNPGQPAVRSPRP